MKKYIGCKIILAQPEDEHSFLRGYKKQDVPQNQENRSGYRVVYPDGYVSWSPKEVFEKAYRLIEPGELELLERQEPQSD